ncbi:MAG: hypothetical protein CMO01_08490 [Thalassobius sp.]|nr:hypothetical protein [Thalassovita sp.]
MENIPVNELNGLLTKYSIQKRASKISYKKDTIVTYKDMNFTLKPIDLINGKPSNLAIYLDTIEMVIFEYDLSTGEFLQEPTFQ